MASEDLGARRPPQTEHPSAAPAVPSAALVRWLAPACGGIAILIGLTLLALWLLGVPPRWSAAGAITTKTNTALAMTLAGGALVLVGGGAAEVGRNRRKAVAALMASLVLLLGALTLLEYLFGIDLRIDELLAAEPPGQPGALSPNRMGPPGALCLVLLGAGLLALAARRRAAVWLGALSCSLLLVSAVGYFYGADQLHANPAFSTIAWPTILAYFALGLGIALSAPGRGGAVPLFWRDDPGGALMRRALGWAVLLPIAIGFVRLLGERRGLYPRLVGTSLFAVSLSIAFSLLVWRSANRLSAVAADRTRAEEGARWRASLLDLSQDAILVWSPEGGIESWNRGAEELYGYAAAEALGRISRDLLQTVFPRPWPEIEAQLRRARRWEGTLEHRTKAGLTVIVSARLQLLRDAEGRDRVLESNRDITAAKRAEDALRESEERHRAIFEHVALGVAEVDQNDRLTAVNDRLCAILGYRREALLGTSVVALTAPEDRARARELNDQVHDGRLNQFDYQKRFLRSDGTPLWVHVTVSAVHDRAGKLLRTVGTIEDISLRRLAEARLKQSEARFRTLTTASSEALYRMSPDWSEMRQLHSRGFLAPIEKPSRTWLQDYVAPEDQPQVLAAIANAIRTESIFELEHRVRRADGSLGWTLSRAVPMKEEEQGAIVEWFGAAIDITESKLARERICQLNASLEHRNAELDAERGRWRGVVEGIAEEVWVSDARGRISLINLPDKTTMGLEEFEGKTVDEVLEEVDILRADGTPRPPEQAPLLVSLRTGRIVRGEEIMRHRRTGKRRVRQYSCAPTRDGTGAITGAVAIARDVTQVKETERALREAGQRKDEFLAMLSHELRNPLAPIRNSLYILDRAPEGDQARRARETIARQVDHLTRIVGDLLDVSRITRGTIELQRQRLNLSELVARTIEDHRSLFAARGIALRFEAPNALLWMNGDPTRLAQVLGNLLQNAAKFTPTGGNVAVELRRVDGDAAQLWVRDTGAGLTADIRSRLFEPFTQADRSLDRTSGGLGLGLALVKGLVELHGGEVRASSAGPGMGSEFTVRLPVEAAPSGPPTRRPHLEIVRPKARRVLVIEDNVDAADSLRDVLELQGHEVAVAYNGPEGLARAQTFSPDVVLCDIGLPGMDGYAVARAFRGTQALQDIALVALTGYASPEDQRRAADAGFDHHMAKPPDIGGIERLLAEVPDHHHVA